MVRSLHLTKTLSRVEIAKSDVKRHKNKNIQWSVLDATKDTFPMAEKILIDAPCTGTGVLGRRPDIKWRLKKRFSIYEKHTNIYSESYDEIFKKRRKGCLCDMFS